jgi:hypothetical protein
MPSVTKSKKIINNKQKKDIFFIKILHKNSFFYLKSILAAGKKCGFVTKLSHILFMSKKM